MSSGGPVGKSNQGMSLLKLSRLCTTTDLHDLQTEPKRTKSPMLLWRRLATISNNSSGVLAQSAIMRPWMLLQGKREHSIILVHTQNFSQSQSSVINYLAAIQVLLPNQISSTPSNTDSPIPLQNLCRTYGWVCVNNPSKESNSN